MGNTPTVTDTPFVIFAGTNYTILAMARSKVYPGGAGYGEPQRFSEVRILASSIAEEGILTPAVDILVNGEEQLRALRAAIDCALGEERGKEKGNG